MEAVGYFLIFSCFLIMIKGQCWSNGTCECHCVDCNTPCTKCSPGWSGSTVNKCQRANTLFKMHDENERNSQTLDGNLNTSVDVSHVNPFVRVQLKSSTEIDRIDITLRLRRGAVYTLYVKEKEHYRAPDAICRTWIHNETDTKRTITMNCWKPLKGRFLEIVSPNNTELKVFEFQRFECKNGTYGENCSNICPTGCDKECDKVSGSCVCRRGFYGTSCMNSCPQSCNEKGCNPQTGDCFECKNGFFGNRCEMDCSLGCYERCNKTTGYCQCKTGYFTEICSLSCPASCINNKCDQKTGECLLCSNDYYGSTCNKTCLGKCQSGCDKLTGLCVNCSDNMYGHFCNLTCPQNCAGNTCKRLNGNCKHCKGGYSGSKCNETCPANCLRCTQEGYSCGTCKDGYFGVTCAQKCPSTCGGNASCDTHTGSCKKCPSGFYGTNCDLICSKYCDSHGKCDQDTGECESCVSGRYGRKCLNECSPNCLNATCFSNQTCVHGCKDGWFGEQCKQDCSAVTGSCAHCGFIEGNDEVKCLRCEDSWFLKEAECFECPENCSSCLSNNLCTQCKNNLFYGTMCDKRCHDACNRKECDVNGTCLYECSNGKYGNKCDQNCPEGCRVCNSASECSECNDGYYGKICQQSCQINCKVCRDNVSCDACKIGWTYQNKTCKTSKLGCSDVSLTCAFCDFGFYGSQCEEKCEHCINATCNDVGNCDIACKPNTNAKQCEAFKKSDGTDPPPEFLNIAIVLLPVTIMTVVIVFIHLKIKRKVRRVKPQENQLTVHVRNGFIAETNELSLYNIRGSQALLTELDPEEDIEEISVPVIENHNYLNVKISRIFVNRLWEFTLKNKANDYLKEEFRDLPEGLLLECGVAKKKGNKKLNRYKHIYPYDTTRVVLNVENGSKTGDYINASYVNGIEKPREYIAAQGPFTDDTINDFWRMIWQSNANTIIILTNLEENDIVKCKMYWPKSEITYGDFHIKMETEESLTLFTVRSFNVNKEGEERTIEQFHFTAWPDKGVPKDVNSILEFRNRVIRKTDITGPLVVHCSAGIGRTGSFIAIDYLIKQGQRDGSVDVVSCVSRIRHQRAHAIQTVEQYIYLYDVITKELTGRQSALLKDEFRNYFSQLKSVNPGTGKQHIEEEFQLIEKLTPTFDEKRYESAKAVNNLSKNRHNNVLPDDNYRLYLSRGESDYINAIQLPDPQRPFGYILTQTPLPNTVGDFLSLVADHEVSSIVMFEHDQEETVGVYLPSNEGPILCDSVELFLLDESELGETDVLHLKIYDKQTQDARFINVFRCHFWKHVVVPENHQPMIDLIEAVLNLRKEHSGHPVLVHCMNGAKQSGMFCVLANLVEQIQLFGTVDILQTVVNMRHRRIQIVPCLAQLEYIYNFVENYLKTIGENRINV